MSNESNLRTTVLPKYNCSNCASFMHKNLEKIETQTAGWYAIECRNLVHPLQDCILRGFKGHSEQPGFTQTINMKINKSGIPKKAGFYFVKSKSSLIWQLLIKLNGTKPFFYVDNINVISGTDTILSNLIELDWSLPIDLNFSDSLNADNWRGFKIEIAVKNQVISYLRQGSKLTAIKYLKDALRNEETDTIGLKDAKEYCDQLQEILGIKY